MSFKAKRIQINF